MDYPCGKFGDFGSIVWKQTQTDADECFTVLTLVSMNKYIHIIIQYQHCKK